ncbi:virion structural protein [Synechococcus phage S-H9-1]|uniref:Structural protein n=1 Tax=Synechococcus phage S-H9-1 TaxID=2783674 RepID=A0A873WSU8_9CAUD|nr:virion structural protein [Synechococcus phage S-H9-1]QPB08154.1 structural protein [Synechococcus phage S-H9-1]
MARKTIQSNYYLFDASAREVIIPGGVQRENLVLITNVTDNKVIYNFSDPELTATEYHISTDIRNVTTTRVVLSYDTTSMADDDQLQIVIDDYEEVVRPSETYHDAVNKAKVSQPQSQIDTDFEYGTQDTKWESLAMINNNPFAYKSQDPIVITDVQATNDSREIVVSVNTSLSTRPAAGAAIYMQDTTFPGANGVFIVDSVDGVNPSNFTYTAKYKWTAASGGIYDSARTALYSGIHYTGSDLGGTITLGSAGGSMTGAVQVDTTQAHGLEVGNEVAVVGSAGVNVNGSWTVARVSSPTRFFYFPDAAPTGAVSTGTIKLYPRPQGSSVHRAFDGGVKFSTNSNSKNQQAIRQTKRYFRYQSGKGVSFSTGSILEPALENIDNISASGTTVTVVAADAHNVTRDTQVDVRGVNDNNYNGIYQVSNVIDPYTFQYIVPNAPTESVAGGEYTVTPVDSYGNRLEIGMMDQQNGIFFRYASGSLSVVRRTSTFQLAGKVSVTNGSTLVSSYTSANGQGTKFSKQLKPGDYIVLRGTSYRVDGIISDTQLVIFPDYRGPSAGNVPVTKTVETEWLQEDWNIDRCNGTGKSGYTIDPTKMQMFYMDYSWYGAGFIRWGFRALDGNVIYAHKIPNNNQNTEAYMRSGNLPARYEVNTLPPATTSTKTFSNSDTTLYIAAAPTHFPTSGTLRVKRTSGATTGVQEYINYTGKTTFIQDVVNVLAGDVIEVASTTGLSPGGQQTVIFDTPFSNVAANKTYYVAAVPSATTFKITSTIGDSTGISLNQETGSALSPLSRATSGAFTGITREQAGATGVSLTIASGSSAGTVSSATGIQKGQRVVGSGIPADTFVHSISGTNIQLSKAVTSANPTGVIFPALGAGGAQTFTYDATQPTSVELLAATSVPQISHWGSSVIMDGLYDDDRAYVYTVGTRTGREINSGDTKALLAIRVSPSVDNGIQGNFGARELINRMQLVLRSAEISTNGSLFVELILNPVISSTVAWQSVGGTSLAQYANLGSILDVDGILNGELIGGEVIFGFYADTGVASYDLSQVKEISNSILGGGTDNYENSTAPNPTGIFPDGPEVLAIQVTNIAGGRGSNRRAADVRISWTEAQA